MKGSKVFVLYIIFILGMFIGAVGHELDMYREYQKDKTMPNTSWVTDWEKE